MADGWIPSLAFMSPDQAPAMMRRVHQAAFEAGRDPEDITCCYNLEVRVDERQPGGPSGGSLVSGSPDVVADRLIAFALLGFTAFNFIVVGPQRGEQAERLAGEVIPAVRAGL